MRKFQLALIRMNLIKPGVSSYFSDDNAVIDESDVWMKSSMDKKLLDILVCPVSKAPLEYDEAKQELICKTSLLAYPIRDGIPVMLEEEARSLDAPTPEQSA